MPMQKYYVAFSIHGTCCFISASIESDKPHDVLLPGSKIVPSRDPYRKDKEAIKLHWDGLTRKKDGKPLTSPIYVIMAFKQLKRMGWTLHDRDKFVNRHWGEKGYKASK